MQLSQGEIFLHGNHLHVSFNLSPVKKTYLGMYNVTKILFFVESAYPYHESCKFNFKINQCWQMSAQPIFKKYVSKCIKKYQNGEIKR
jgi:hypothetical protein